MRPLFSTAWVYEAPISKGESRSGISFTGTLVAHKELANGTVRNADRNNTFLR